MAAIEENLKLYDCMTRSEKQFILDVSMSTDTMVSMGVAAIGIRKYPTAVKPVNTGHLWSSISGHYKQEQTYTPVFLFHSSCVLSRVYTSILQL